MFDNRIVPMFVGCNPRELGEDDCDFPQADPQNSHGGLVWIFSVVMRARAIPVRFHRMSQVFLVDSALPKGLRAGVSCGNKLQKLYH